MNNNRTLDFLHKSTAAAFITLIVTTAGCANWTHLTRDRDIADDSNAEIVLIDAKQRAIIASKPTPVDGRIKEYSGGDSSNPYERAVLRVCSEPSPDALSALAASAGLNLSRQDSIDLATQLALAESAGSIGIRTQSIQLMRDSMYRICEGYLSGALSPIAYETLHRRLMSSMVAILAIEQITGVVQAAPVQLGTSAVSGSAELLAKYTEKTEQARTGLSQAKKTEEENMKKLSSESEKVKTLKGEKENKDKELKALESDLNANSESEEAAQNAITELDERIKAAEEAGESGNVDSLKAEKSSKQKSLNELQERSKKLESDLSVVREKAIEIEANIKKAEEAEATAKKMHEESVANRKAKEEELDAYEKARKSAVSGTGSAKAVASITLDPCCEREDKEAASAISKEVLEIVKQTLKLDYSSEMCISVLVNLRAWENAIEDNSLAAACRDLLTAATNLTESKSELLKSKSMILNSVSQSATLNSVDNLEALSDLIESLDEEK